MDNFTKNELRIMGTLLMAIGVSTEMDIPHLRVVFGLLWTFAGLYYIVKASRLKTDSKV